MRIVDYDGWSLWKADVSTTESSILEVKDLTLSDDTVITGIRFEYGSVSADFTTRRDNDSWNRNGLKDEHDDLDDATASLKSDLHGAIIRMCATSSYTPQTALANSARVDLCRNGGGEKLESHDKDRVVQKCAIPQDLPNTGNAPIISFLTALLTAGGTAIWLTWLSSASKEE